MCVRTGDEVVQGATNLKPGLPRIIERLSQQHREDTQGPQVYGILVYGFAWASVTLGGARFFGE